MSYPARHAAVRKSLRTKLQLWRKPNADKVAPKVSPKPAPLAMSTELLPLINQPSVMDVLYPHVPHAYRSTEFSEATTRGWVRLHDFS